ncbi:MAG: hypothetical protein J4G01_02500 [Dehalococcoidia bacterium]|nr:hypothetical protein [Dehalococcoidia bacterium]
MVQIREATAKLRMLLAEIRGREEQMDATIRQFNTQLARLPRQAAYSRTSLDAALSSMNEVQERLDYAKAAREHLLAIKQQATAELEALQITQQVEAAKEALRQLESKQSSQGPLDEAEQREVRKLEGFIAEYSKVAERAITASLDDR